ncbi:MAG: hypothetical protein JST90_19795 [Bacteroidetes bacterium]|nr:hypothetical protein [Bacteroidota bacterium]
MLRKQFSVIILSIAFITSIRAQINSTFYLSTYPPIGYWSYHSANSGCIYRITSINDGIAEIEVVRCDNRLVSVDSILAPLGGATLRNLGFSKKYSDESGREVSVFYWDINASNISKESNVVFIKSYIYIPQCGEYISIDAVRPHENNKVKDWGFYSKFLTLDTSRKIYIGSSEVVSSGNMFSCMIQLTNNDFIIPSNAIKKASVIKEIKVDNSLVSQDSVNINSNSEIGYFNYRAGYHTLACTILVHDFSLHQLVDALVNKTNAHNINLKIDLHLDFIVSKNANLFDMTINIDSIRSYRKGTHINEGDSIISKYSNFIYLKEADVTYLNNNIYHNNVSPTSINSNPTYLELQNRQSYTEEIRQDRLSTTQVYNALKHYEGNGKQTAGAMARLHKEQRRLVKNLSLIARNKVLIDKSLMDTLQYLSDFISVIKFQKDRLDRVELSTVNDLAKALNELLSQTLMNNTGPDSVSQSKYARIVRSLSKRADQLKRNGAWWTGTSFYYELTPTNYASKDKKALSPQISIALWAPPFSSSDTLMAMVYALRDLPNNKFDSISGLTACYRDQGAPKGTIHTLNGSPTTPAIGRIPSGDWYVWLWDSKKKKIVSELKDLIVEPHNTRYDPAKQFFIF